MKLSEETKARVEELHQERRAIQEGMKPGGSDNLPHLLRQLERVVRKIRRIESGMPGDDPDDLPN